ncbi:MAG: hypothetical protein LBB66_02785 [Desulfovibrio sp.]|jgi:hypothetical protein|nr:hypothetical protein [Desulfovibrio sp.]
MCKNISEVFGQFTYGEALSYEELLAAEQALIGALENLMLRAGAEHPDFTPTGDMLLCQCAFEKHKLYVYRKFAHEIAGLLPAGVTGRLLCFEKNFGSLYVYWIQPGQWEEEERPIPPAPPPGLKIKRVNKNGKQTSPYAMDMASAADA